MPFMNREVPGEAVSVVCEDGDTGGYAVVGGGRPDGD